MILSRVKVGQKVKIESFAKNFQEEVYLLGLGILPGDQLEVTSISPLGSPISFKHGDGNYFALRKNQASQIIVKQI